MKYSTAIILVVSQIMMILALETPVSVIRNPLDGWNKLFDTIVDETKWSDLMDDPPTTDHA
jgi:hypothetical protein